MHAKFSLASLVVAPLPRFLETFELIASSSRWDEIVAEDAKHVLVSRCFRVFWQTQFHFASSLSEIETKLALLLQFRDGFLLRRASTMTTTTMNTTVPMSVSHGSMSLSHGSSAGPTPTASPSLSASKRSSHLNLLSSSGNSAASVTHVHERSTSSSSLHASAMSGETRKTIVKTYWPPVFAYLEAYAAKCRDGT